MFTKLYDWQKPSADHLTQIYYSDFDSALDASFTGAGKTYVALQVAKNLGATPLIIAPKAVLTGWQCAANELNCPVVDILNVEKLKTGNTPYLTKGNRKNDFVWKLEPGTFVIFDEVHRYSGYRTQNAFLLALTKAYKLRTLLLSATVADSPLKLKAIGYLLGLHRFKNHYSWCLNHGCYKNAWNGLDFTTGPARIPFMKEIHESIFPERGVRLRVTDVPDFPQNSIQAEAYDLEGYTDEVNKIYDEMDDALANPDENENPLVLMLRARQRTELCKVPLLTDMAQELLIEGNRVVIFVSFRDTLDIIVSQLTNVNVSVIKGGQKREIRDRNIAAFQSGDTHVCVCMIQAGGLGISLDDQVGDAPRVSLITPSYSAIDLKQALGRINRANSKSPAIQKILFAAGTIEEAACKAVSRKLENIDMINDGDLQEGIGL